MRSTTPTGVRVFLALVILLAAGAWGASRAQAQDAAKADPAGTWVWFFDTPDGSSIATTLTLQREDQKLSGSLVSDFDGETVPVSDGTFKDGTVDFKMVRDFNGQSFAVEFKGKLEGDAIHGNAQMGDTDQGQSFPWDAKRVGKKADPVGTWVRTGPMESRSTSFTLTISRAADGKLSGKTKHGPDGPEEAVSDLKVSGEDVSFVYKRQGRVSTEYRYTGKLSGDALKGTEQSSAAADSKLPWNMKRVKAAAAAAGGVAGNWKWTIDTGGGQPIERSAALKVDGGKLTGTSTANGNESPLSDGAIQGNDVAFTINIDFGGTAITTKYKGTLDGDHIKGTIQSDFGGGEPTTLDWNATRQK